MDEPANHKLLSSPAVALVLVAAVGAGGVMAAHASDPQVPDYGLVITVDTETTPIVNEEWDVCELISGFSSSRIAELGCGDGPFESSVTIYIREDLMRLDLGGSSLVMRLDADGAAGTWGVLDETSGKIMNTVTFDEGINRNLDGQDVGKVTVTEPSIERTESTDVILGIPVTGYRYSYRMQLEPFGADQPLVEKRVVGLAWIAADTMLAESYSESRVLGVLTTNLVGIDLHMGMPLRNHETVYFAIRSQADAEGTEWEASSSWEVTGLTRRPLGNALFGLDQPATKECDCTCDAYARLRAIKELSRAEQEAHPEAMTLAMCAPDCGLTWAQYCGED